MFTCWEHFKWYAHSLVKCARSFFLCLSMSCDIGGYPKTSKVQSLLVYPFLFVLFVLKLSFVMYLLLRSRVVNKYTYI